MLLTHPLPLQQVPGLHNAESSFIPRVTQRGGPDDSSIHYEKEPLNVDASLKQKSEKHEE